MEWWEIPLTDSEVEEQANRLATVVSALHNHEHSWKNAKASICRANQGTMRRVMLRVAAWAFDI